MCVNAAETTLAVDPALELGQLTIPCQPHLLISLGSRPAVERAAAVVDQDGRGSGEDVVGVDAGYVQVVGGQVGPVAPDRPHGDCLAARFQQLVAFPQVRGIGKPVFDGVPDRMLAGGLDHRTCDEHNRSHLMPAMVPDHLYHRLGRGHVLVWIGGGDFLARLHLRDRDRLPVCEQHPGVSGERVRATRQRRIFCGYLCGSGADPLGEPAGEGAT